MKYITNDQIYFDSTAMNIVGLQQFSMTDGAENHYLWSGSWWVRKVWHFGHPDEYFYGIMQKLLKEKRDDQNKRMKTSVQLKYSVGKSQDSFATKKFVVSVKKQQMDLI